MGSPAIAGEADIWPVKLLAAAAQCLRLPSVA